MLAQPANSINQASLELMMLFNNQLNVDKQLELMNLDRSTAEQEMDEMVANSQLASMMDSLT